MAEAAENEIMDPLRITEIDLGEERTTSTTQSSSSNKIENLFSGSCCVPGCKSRNDSKKPPFLKFYRFPRRDYVQRALWIKLVKKQVVGDDEIDWEPKPWNKICSGHFYKGEKSVNNNHPSYVPSIFPNQSKYDKVATLADEERYQRAMKRRNLELKLVNNTSQSMKTTPAKKSKSQYTEKGTQTWPNSRTVSTETKYTNIPIYKNASTNYQTKTLTFIYDNARRSDESFKAYTGITIHQFDVLLFKLVDDDFKLDFTSVSIEEQLFIFLRKMRSNNSFMTLSIDYGLHRSTVSKIFHKTLNWVFSQLAEGGIIWPNKMDLINTTPSSFEKKYPDVRVIIGSFESRCDSSSKMPERKQTLIKFLVGIIPSGKIVFKSNAVNYESLHHLIKKETELCRLLEAGDIVMGDKGFPGVFQVVDSSIETPILKSLSTNSNNAVNPGPVRMYFEKVIGQIRNFKILEYLSSELISDAEKIFQCVCFLVNIDNNNFTGDIPELERRTFMAVDNNT